MENSMLMTLNTNDTLEVSSAEREIIGIAVRRPCVWHKISHVPPEWFRSWSMQTVWRALLHCYEVNDGLAELQVLTDWITRNCRESEVDGLLHVMVDCADEYQHGEFLEHYLSILEHAGSRLAIERWAGHVVQMCKDGRAIRDIRDAVMSPPIHERGAA
jgi:hypothetical protein